MEVAEGVHLLSRGEVNWWAIVDRGRVTLVDSGLRAQWRQVETALGAIGFGLADVEAVLLTHGHPDHTGTAERLRRSGAAVYAHPADEPFIVGPPARPPLSKVLSGLAWLRRPAFLRSTAHFVREGLLWPERVATLSTFDDGDQVDVPGQPRVLHMPGHTAGSCALLIEDRDVVFTGDALVTRDVYSGRLGPRLSADASNEDSDAALASLARLQGLSVAHVCPGHGEAWSSGAAEAARRAREAGAA